MISIVGGIFLGSTLSLTLSLFLLNSFFNTPIEIKNLYWQEAAQLHLPIDPIKGNVFAFNPDQYTLWENGPQFFVGYYSKKNNDMLLEAAIQNAGWRTEGNHIYYKDTEQGRLRLAVLYENHEDSHTNKVSIILKLVSI